MARERVKDAIPFLFAMVIVAMFGFMIWALVSLTSEAMSEDVPTKKPADHEVIEESSNWTTVTYCSHGTRVWVTRSNTGSVAIDTQPGC